MLCPVLVNCCVVKIQQDEIFLLGAVFSSLFDKSGFVDRAGLSKSNKKETSVKYFLFAYFLRCIARAVVHANVFNLANI